ncbi:hypothetical protein EMIT0357P_40549 [Pseudomonas marginalis]
MFGWYSIENAWGLIFRGFARSNHPHKKLNEPLRGLFHVCDRPAQRHRDPTHRRHA